MGPGVLSEILSKLPKPTGPNLLVGFDASDDACAYKISDALAVIQTVDFFPPIVDDPYLYGQIAAANALSDIYAMGGTPTLALNLLCLPSCLDLSVAQQILAGGHSKVDEAGAVIAGGHSIDDPVPKYGLCVTGFIHPDEIWTNAGAKEGDVLILTKPLGSGITTTAAKADAIECEKFQRSLDVMATLNKYARDAMAKTGVNACTDVTGFGLMGHAYEMAAASGKTLELFSGALPLLPEAAELAKMGVIPGGAYRNRDYVKEHAEIAKHVPEHLIDILCDPQTSGGLLAAVPEDKANELMALLEDAAPYARIVGRVTAKGAHALVIT